MRSFLTEEFATRQIPFLRPTPPRLSEHIEELRQLEESGQYSNFGPVNTRFEQALREKIFHNTGAVTSVANATLGLMLAIKAVTGDELRNRYALMPSFTFAATAQAALWAGLQPVFCDIDPYTWLPDKACEAKLIEQFGDQIAVVIPYATFGANLDLEYYETLGLPVVVDAAASLGTLGADGRGFGTGCKHPIVYSLHATKTFSTSEGGVVYCEDDRIIKVIREMSNFGFGEPRIATMLGLNAKMSEIGALSAILKLNDLTIAVQRRLALFERYKSAGLPLTFQASTTTLQAHQFVPVLLPTTPSINPEVAKAYLSDLGIGTAAYFRPHLAQHPYFLTRSIAGSLQVTEDVSSRVISLPLSEAMTFEEVDYVCGALRDCIETPSRSQQ